MGWRFRIETEGDAVRVTARNLAATRHVALYVADGGGRLTHLGDGPHHPCRMLEALSLDWALIMPPAANPSLAAEITASREVPVGAPLNWRTRLQAAAELDRLSGVVADELAALGVRMGEIGLAPVLHLQAGSDAVAIPVWFGAEAEMRADFVKARSGAAAHGLLSIAAMGITAYGPAPAGTSPAPPTAPSLPRLAIGKGSAKGPGTLSHGDAVFVIDRRWAASPAEGAVARLARVHDED